MGRRNTIEDFLLNSTILIENSIKDAEVTALLNEFGYTPEKLVAGKALLDKANELHVKQKKEYSEQYTATSVLDEKFALMQKTYMIHFKVAKVACMEDTEKRNKLGLLGARKQTIAGLLDQATIFYESATNEAGIQESMAEYGITKEKLDAGKALVDDAVKAKVEKERETGEAQQATANRDKAFDDLSDWVSKLRKIARIALAETPQYLEKLGIKA